MTTKTMFPLIPTHPQSSKLAQALKKEPPARWARKLQVKTVESELAQTLENRSRASEKTLIKRGYARVIMETIMRLPSVRGGSSLLIHERENDLHWQTSPETTATPSGKDIEAPIHLPYQRLSYMLALASLNPVYSVYSRPSCRRNNRTKISQKFTITEVWAPKISKVIRAAPDSTSVCMVSPAHEPQDDLSIPLKMTPVKEVRRSEAVAWY